METNQRGARMACHGGGGSQSCSRNINKRKRTPISTPTPNPPDPDDGNAEGGGCLEIRNIRNIKFNPDPNQERSTDGPTTCNPPSLPGCKNGGGNCTESQPTLSPDPPSWTDAGTENVNSTMTYTYDIFIGQPNTPPYSNPLCNNYAYYDSQNGSEDVSIPCRIQTATVVATWSRTCNC